MIKYNVNLRSCQKLGGIVNLNKTYIFRIWMYSRKGTDQKYAVGKVKLFVFTLSSKIIYCSNIHKKCSKLRSPYIKCMSTFSLLVKSNHAENTAVNESFRKCIRWWMDNILLTSIHDTDTQFSLPRMYQCWWS